MTNRSSTISFLVDTGAVLCVYPRNKLRGPASKDDYDLFAANGTHIATYGTIPVSLNLSLQRDFKWSFVVADVNTPIILQTKNVVEYNTGKTTVDLSDQMSAYCSPLRKAVKWHRKLAFKLFLSIAGMNALFMFQDVTRRKMSIMIFRK